MNKNMKKATLAFAVFMVFIIGIVYAATWHMHITWKIEDTSIGVYTDVECTDPWVSPLDLQTVPSGSQTPIVFYIKNQGSVLIDISVINEAWTGTDNSAEWTFVNNIGVAVNDHAQATLILTLTTDGSYDFDFSSTATP